LVVDTSGPVSSQYLIQMLESLSNQGRLT
jgi:hypothetical protein